jgi:hypothetical protein
MSLYHEIPKDAIMGLLHERFSAEELDAVRPELNNLLVSCNSMAELQNRIYESVKRKQVLRDYRVTHEMNFSGS